MSTYTEFETKLLVASYLLSEELGQEKVSVRDVLEKYRIDPKPNWIRRAITSFTDSGLAKGRMHMGAERDQRIWLTAYGVKEAERLLDEEVVSIRVPEDAKDDAAAEDPDDLLRQIIPASDRVVSPSHNAVPYVDAVRQIEESRRAISDSNQLSEDEKWDALVHLDAGISILKKAKQFAIGTMRYLVLDRLKTAFEGAIEDAFKVVIIGAFMALAAFLISMI